MSLVNRGSISYHFQDYLRQEILTMAEADNLSAIELMSELATLSDSEISALYFPNDGHLTPAGHRFVAETIARHLAE